MDDILVNKAATIERCIKRINEEYQKDTAAFTSDHTRQDSVILNIQRACEAAIDMGNRLIKLNRLALPQTSKDVFAILASEKMLDTALSNKLQAMVGLRNIAVHDYQNLNLDIVIHVVENNLTDFEHFITQMFTAYNNASQ